MGATIAVVNEFIEWFKPVKAHVTIIRNYNLASNLNKSTYDGFHINITSTTETMFLKPNALIIHVVSEHGSIYGLLGIDKHSFTELFDNLVKIEELEYRDVTNLLPDKIFCTEHQDLPSTIRAPRIHWRCKLVIMVASPIIDQAFFKTRLVARIYTSREKPSTRTKRYSTIRLHKNTPSTIQSSRSSKGNTYLQ